MANNYSLEDVIDICNDMLETYKPLREDQQKLDKIARLRWELPSGMPSWARPFRTTVPYDAIKAGVECAWDTLWRKQ